MERRIQKSGIIIESKKVKELSIKRNIISLNKRNDRYQSLKRKKKGSVA